MKHQKTARYLLILILLLGLILVSSGCLTTGSRFLEDVSKTLCCFSPAMVLPGGALLLYISRG